MNVKKLYVQKELSLELNKDIISKVEGYKSYVKLANGVEINCIENFAIEASKGSGLSDLFTNYGDKKLLEERQNCRDIKVRISVVSSEIVRITVNPQDNSRDDLFVKYPDSIPHFWVEENDDILCIKTEKIEVIVDKQKMTYSIRDKQGNVVLEENNEEKSIYYGYYSPPLGRVKVDGEVYLGQSFKRHYDEDFYGFGESFMDFNKRGLVNEIWNVDPANTMSYKSYKNIPFFISTRGYGFLLNSSRKAYFDMGSKTAGAYHVKVQGDVLDYFIIVDSEPKKILRKYYQLTGKPAVPPKWSFGLWMSSPSTYNNQEALVNIARELRERRLPTDVLHIDPWWMGVNSLVCTLEWGENFKDYSWMIKELKSRGFKLSLWIAPYVPLNCSMYNEGIENGYFVKDKDGNVIVNAGPMNFWSPEFVYVDFTNPEAERWFKERLKKLLKDGVDVIKVDLGELGPEEALYYNGMDGKEGHNYYPLEYQRVVYEAIREVKGEQSIIWCRSGFIGSHKYPVHWAGDVKCDFDNMAGQLRAILSAGMSGFIFFSHDIGGFIGVPTPELYIRWFQFGMFTSHARCHGGAPHEPWHYGDEAMEICKKFAEIRYSLIPHIFSSAVECCENGEPMVKPLVLEYPGDLNVRNIDTEYLFCNDFLVAPMFKKEGIRKIYLPEGKWIDYWTHEIYDGGKWIDYNCPLDILPLFVKWGSIIIKTEPRQYIDENESWGKIIIEIYAGVSGRKKLYINNNDYGVIEYSVEQDKIYIKIDNIQEEIEVKIVDPSGRISGYIMTY